MKLGSYIAIARPDHWFKNVFLLPGTLLAALTTRAHPATFGVKFVLGVVSVCLIASANYVINEWLDAEFDRYHPIKKNRPSVAGGLRPAFVYLEYALLGVAGIALGYQVSPWFGTTGAWLALMGVLYNVRPFRTKDRVYLDVLSESINNPIRLLLGWFIVTDLPLPPSSLLIAYWMGGAFLMAVKRYAELREIGPGIAAQYRRSFRFYTLERLLISILFYASCASFFLGVFLIKHRIELIVTLPFLALLFAWYMQLGFKSDSAVQAPEKLYRERAFSIYVLFVSALLLAAAVVRIPALDALTQRSLP